FDLERHYKSVVHYFNDTTNNLVYSFVLFTLGNYSHTFNWVTVVFFAAGLLGYTLLVELPFLKVSLPTWRTWGLGAWLVHLGAAALVVLAAVWHIKWAADAGFVGWYLGLFALATATIWGTVLVNALNSWHVSRFPGGSGLDIAWRRVVIAMTTRPSRCSTHQRQSRRIPPPCMESTPRLHSEPPYTRINSEHRLGSAQLQRQLHSQPADSLVAACTDAASPTTAVAPALSFPLRKGKDSLSDQGSTISTRSAASTRSDIPLNEIDTTAPSTSNSGCHYHSALATPTGTDGSEMAPAAGLSSLARSLRLSSIPISRCYPHYLNYPNYRCVPRAHFHVHIHHWQLFYIFAFFTRFDTFASRLCAGIVLGIYVHGIAAYGFDPMLVLSPYPDDD
ncbi:hypothetical protein EV182_001956, partial [Spiromyces aspiralis]